MISRRLLGCCLRGAVLGGVLFGLTGCMTSRGPVADFRTSPYFIASRFLDDIRWAVETKNPGLFRSRVSGEFVPDELDLIDDFDEQLANEASVYVWYHIDRILKGRDDRYEVRVNWRKVYQDLRTAKMKREQGVGYIVLEIRDGRARLLQKRGKLFF